MGNQTAKQREFAWDEEREERAFFEAIREAADRVGFKELLYLIGCDRTTLANRLACRDGREPRATDLLALLRLDDSAELMAHLCAAAGYAMPERLELEDPEERAARLVAELREFGAAGAAAIQRARGGRP